MLIGSRYAVIFSASARRFRYLKLSITANYGGVDVVQLSYLTFVHDPSDLAALMTLESTDSLPSAYPWPANASISVPTEGSSTERAINILSLQRNKYSASFVTPHDIVIDLGYGRSIDVDYYKYWGWCSADDYPGRDPYDFVLYGSNDSLTWEVLDNAAESGNATWLCSDERYALQYIGKVGGDSLRGIPYDGSLIINDRSYYIQHPEDADNNGTYTFDSDTPLSPNGTLSVLV